jgi:galactokinase
VAWALGLGDRGAAAGSGGASLYINSAVPTGSGLSSAALECAAALALRDLNGLGTSRAELALACQRAENDVAGAPTGIMDAATAVEAGAAGARMTGGGFGGAVIALVARERSAQTAEAIAAAFARAGYAAPRLSTVAPSDGARRDR